PRRAHVRADHDADHGLDRRAATRVRDEHRHHRAGVVHLARHPAGGVLRLPALLRTGAACRLGEVMPRIAIVGGGLTGFVAYLTLRRGSIPAEHVAVFSPDADPAAAWRARAASIRQTHMRSESDGHCLPTTFPGLAVREARRRRSLAPLLASACDRYNPTA